METTVSVKGQIVIPVAVRKSMGIHAGTRIQVEPDMRNHRIILTPVTREAIEGLRGRFRGRGLLSLLAAEKKRERDL